MKLDKFFEFVRVSRFFLLIASIYFCISYNVDICEISVYENLGRHDIVSSWDIFIACWHFASFILLAAMSTTGYIHDDYKRELRKINKNYNSQCPCCDEEDQ